MATTTPNFGWSVPTSTDLVKDGATAIELLGDSIDTSLVDLKGGTTGQVLSKTSGTDMDFTWVTTDDTNAIQNAIVDAKGDLIGASAADTPARLAVGTNGQVLTADSTEATGLKWASPSGGGKVLQVINATTTTNTLNSTSTFADATGLAATITPTLATSKVLVLVSASGLMKTSANADNAVQLRLLRGATTILEISSSEGYTGTALLNVTSASTSYLDSPATTSATTYKVQIANYINGARASINTQLGGVNTNSTITLMEIGA
jgi:hypothetical protein